MVNSTYIPEKGDLIWLDFTPNAGHEQGGKRPALVLSPKEYNRITGLCVLLPVTSKIKGYPFEVKVDEPGIGGAILPDQIKSLDRRAKNTRLIIKESPNVFQETVGIFKTLIE